MKQENRSPDLERIGDLRTIFLDTGPRCLVPYEMDRLFFAGAIPGYLEEIPEKTISVCCDESKGGGKLKVASMSTLEGRVNEEGIWK